MLEKWIGILYLACLVTGVGYFVATMLEFTAISYSLWWLLVGEALMFCGLRTWDIWRRD